jgi:hypothetical protein
VPEPTRNECFTLVIEALADDETPALVRLRRWLKAGLRTYGLRCHLAAVNTPAPPPPAAPAAAQEGNT